MYIYGVLRNMKETRQKESGWFFFNVEFNFKKNRRVVWTEKRNCLTIQGTLKICDGGMYLEISVMVNFRLFFLKGFSTYCKA
jgi:hypothetical protein